MAWQARETRDALAKALYEGLFKWIVGNINTSIQCEQSSRKIAILDIFGFENFPVSGKTRTNQNKTEQTKEEEEKKKKRSFLKNSRSTVSSNFASTTQMNSSKNFSTNLSLKWSKRNMKKRALTGRTSISVITRPV